MPDTKRKYLSEFAINFCSKGWLLITSSQLASNNRMNAEMKELSDVCHIYLICRLPMLRFDEKTFVYGEDIIKGNLIYRFKGKEYFLPFAVPFPMKDGAVDVKLTEYPHREIRTYDSNGDVIRYLPASALAISHGLHYADDRLSNLEVLYVGQAFGDGSRSAFERLRSHSTLQKILADVHYESPDYEVFLALYEYDAYNVITSMYSNAQVTGDDDTARFHSILDHPLSDHQQICLVEAGLIRYFRPHYNKIYKDHFPKQDQKILLECYNLDFSGLIVEINSEDLWFRMSSETVQPSYHHIAQYSLVNEEERWGFFHFLDKDGEAIPIDNVINSGVGR